MMLICLLKHKIMISGIIFEAIMSTIHFNIRVLYKYLENELRIMKDDAE